ncbi:MAG: L-glutamate gamma-semialdehyde dehydrogenase [Acidobacteria bacterium]|nr:L-glutamate gamma-semialdehyde dehydrogenase [Acidobacteriota bacterium]
MSNAFFKVPQPHNEPVREYRPGTAERASIKKELERQAQTQVEVPLIIGGKEVRTGKTKNMVMPHDHQHILGQYHVADESCIQMAVEASQKAWRDWSETPWEERAAIFLKAGELLAGPYRDILNAATMLNQSKTMFQAEIDSACELIDFFRFNTQFMTEIYQEQPNSSPGMWNRSEYRALEGFIFAVTPFNFTSIAGNLPTSPAMMGNVALWKPASTAVLSGYYIMQILKEAGLPDGVINFIPGQGAQVGDLVLGSKDFAGVHFTGSTGVFNGMWRSIAENLDRYGRYPRIVGETGGKDFVFAHASADVDSLAVALLRGAFEYQGQKCSAASRAYIPQSIWPQVRDRLYAHLETVKLGDVRDFTHFMGAVIDKSSFSKLERFIQAAKSASDAKVGFGGGCDASKGYFIQPTVIETENPAYETMCEELFGPVLTIHPYADDAFAETLAICDQTSPYALTGAIFANDRNAVMAATRALRHAAGNFYINDKPTGAVVGQQPFGGGRASGTNDKAGSKINLLKWVNARSIKETFCPPKSYGYPFMNEA